MEKAAFLINSYVWGIRLVFSFRLSYGIEEERHQATHVAADTAIHQRQDVRYHPYAEDKGNSA